MKTVIGTMSGTSLDGIDISIVKTDGKVLRDLNKNFTQNYSKKLIREIKDLINNKNYSQNYLNELCKKITSVYIIAIKKAFNIFKDKIDVISLHGQTIYHSAIEKKSLQLVDAKKISNYFKVPVVFNFRANDLKNGGQGAPLAPIYHKYLISKNNIDTPACFVNIGGISNLTYIDDNNIIGFDTGPGNVLINDFVQLKTDFLYDNLGKFSRLGSKNNKVLNEFISHPFFLKKFPKSADRNEFHEVFLNKEFKKLNFYNQISTLTHFTSKTIINSLKFLPKYPKYLLICGGGQHNKSLIDYIKISTTAKVLLSKQIKLNGDFLEAHLMAYLAIRSIKNLPITFPQTTGVKKPISGGEIIYPAI